MAGLTESSATKMGLLHAFYGMSHSEMNGLRSPNEGLGAMIAPFAATEFAKMARNWSFHFVVSVGLAAVNTIILLLVFRGKHQDGVNNFWRRSFLV